jgi:hypothetical protein
MILQDLTSRIRAIANVNSPPFFITVYGGLLPVVTQPSVFQLINQSMCLLGPSFKIVGMQDMVRPHSCYSAVPILAKILMYRVQANLAKQAGQFTVSVISRSRFMVFCYFVLRAPLCISRNDRSFRMNFAWWWSWRCGTHSEKKWQKNAP